MRYWLRLPPFWRFQLAGWAACIFSSLPYKIVLVHSISEALLLSGVRDGSSFLLTVGLRYLYLYCWSLPGHLMAALMIGISVGAGILQIGFFLMLQEIFPFEEESLFGDSALLNTFYQRTGLLLSWSFLYFGVRQMMDAKDRQTQLARVESAYQAQQLRMQRALMNPHFLFNALNFIKSELLGKDDSLARMVQAFSNYLKYSLITSDKIFVEAGKEYDAIEGYLAVEKARFGNEIESQCRIDPEARLALVPGIIIQPLVENAIKHGRRQVENVPLKINVFVTRTAQELRLEVSNSGQWQPPSEVDGPSRIGLKSLKERLRLLYGDRHHFEILTGANQVTVKVSLPISI